MAGNDVEIDELLPSTSSNRVTTDNDLKYVANLLIYVIFGSTKIPINSFQIAFCGNWSNPNATIGARNDCGRY